MARCYHNAGLQRLVILNVGNAALHRITIRRGGLGPVAGRPQVLCTQTQFTFPGQAHGNTQVNRAPLLHCPRPHPAASLRLHHAADKGTTYCAFAQTQTERFLVDPVEPGLKTRVQTNTIGTQHFGASRKQMYATQAGTQVETGSIVTQFNAATGRDAIQRFDPL